MVEKYEMIATTLMGLENILAEEIKALRGERVTPLKRAVRFFGDDRLLYKANLSLRTALRILVPIEQFQAVNEDDLYRKIKRIQWEHIFSPSETFMITAVVSGGVFRHSKYVALKSKDAIADRFREKYSRRPSVDTDNPDFYIHLHVNRDQASVAIDSTGKSLDRRGYRQTTTEAPINEVLAAGIILMSGWKPDLPLFDPLAGSGTFSIEAALIGTQTPPNLNRSFAFQNWGDYDQNLFERAKFEVTQRIRDSSPLKIYTRDILTENIDAIASNAALAGVEDHLSLKKEDFFKSKPSVSRGMVFINPPYGERLRVSEIEAFYENLGNHLKNNYAGFDVWIISSDFRAMNAIHLRPSLRLEMMNGGLKVRLVKYELFRKRT